MLVKVSSVTRGSCGRLTVHIVYAISGPVPSLLDLSTPGFPLCSSEMQWYHLRRGVWGRGTEALVRLHSGWSGKWWFDSQGAHCQTAREDTEEDSHCPVGSKGRQRGAKESKRKSHFPSAGKETKIRYFLLLICLRSTVLGAKFWNEISLIQIPNSVSRLHINKD